MKNFLVLFVLVKKRNRTHPVLLNKLPRVNFFEKTRTFGSYQTGYIVKEQESAESLLHNTTIYKGRRKTYEECGKTKTICPISRGSRNV